MPFGDYLFTVFAKHIIYDLITLLEGAIKKIRAFEATLFLGIDLRECKVHIF